MAVAAVPRDPFITERTDKEDDLDLKERIQNEYLRLMAVPAVPGPPQEVRKPKDSINSVVLNVENTLKKIPSTRSPIRNIPGNILSTSTVPKPHVTKSRTSGLNQVSTEPIFDKSETEKKEIRKKFKRCHSRCVQQFCLPVENLNVYEECLGKCKSLCT